MFHLGKQFIILIICGCVFLLLLIIGIIVFLNKPKPNPNANPINTFVAVGQGSDNIAWSDDGKNWNKIATGSDFNIRGDLVASNGNVWVVADSYSSEFDDPKNMIFSKDNARTWARINQPQNCGNSVNGLVWDGTHFIAVFDYGNSGDTMAQWSKDGQNWNPSTGVVDTGDAVSLQALGCNEEICIALTYYGIIIFSEDNGKSWTNATGDQFSHEKIVLGSFVAVNDEKYCVAIAKKSKNTNILWSYKGKDWTTPRKNIFTGNIELYCVAHGNGSNWVVVGNGGIGYSSDNGQTWVNATKNNVPITDCFSSVVYNGKIWVASGSYFILYSSDGINWTKSDTNNSNVETHLCWNGTIWVSGGYQSPALRWSDDVTKPWNLISDTFFKTTNEQVGAVHNIACRYKV